jgi:Zn-dependent protease with chaperone function
MSGPTASTPDRKRQLQAGLAALKQGDYPGAIAYLADLPRTPADPLSTKAQMGLVVAYGKLGQMTQAVALCQELATHGDPQVRLWAEKTQTQLTLPPQPAPSLDRTGFVPLETPKQAPVAGSASDDATGFVPLAAEPASRSGSGLPATTGQMRRGRRSPISPVSPPSGGAEDTPSQAQSPTSPAYRPEWRQAGRGKLGQTLGKVDLWPLWLVQAATAVALFWMVQQLVFQPSTLYWQIVVKLPLLQISHAMGEPPVGVVVIGLVLLGVGSRWFLDALLMRVYGLRPLTLKALAALSPETGRSLARFCSQRRIPIPQLGLLPGSEPLAFSYGALPRITRIVVSQGLLDQLADDEIATIYAQEVGQISLRTVPLLSLILVVAQIPYTLYWTIAQWGRDKNAPTSRVAATVGAALSYGAYALIRWLGLWTARSRMEFGDRIAAELTGNPNGYTRALLKLAIGLTATVMRQGQTSHLLEGFDLVQSLALHSGVTLGSLHPHTPLESLLRWDYSSPYRSYLSVNQTHPPLGDRLYRLALYARQWQLEPELDFGPDLAGINRRRQLGLTGPQWRILLLQAAPFVGIGIGWLMAQGLLGMGVLGFRWRIEALQWMMGDRSLLQSLPLIGFSLGSVLRINAFFPDILPSVNLANASIAELLMPNDRLPVHSQPIQLQGKLLGRSGLNNTLSQDLWLHTPQGMVRLHSLSQWGPLGNLLPQTTPVTALVNQEVVVTGWWRRGATPWIDIETVRSRLGRTHASQHPIWSTLLAAIAALLGIYTIIQAGRF